jgi:hypothetical protein
VELAEQKIERIAGIGLAKNARAIRFLSVVGCLLSVIGYRLSVVGYLLSVV